MSLRKILYSGNLELAPPSQDGPAELCRVDFDPAKDLRWFGGEFCVCPSIAIEEFNGKRRPNSLEALFFDPPLPTVTDETIATGTAKYTGVMPIVQPGLQAINVPGVTPGKTLQLVLVGTWE